MIMVGTAIVIVIIIAAMIGFATFGHAPIRSTVIVLLLLAIMTVMIAAVAVVVVVVIVSILLLHLLSHLLLLVSTCRRMVSFLYIVFGIIIIIFR